MYAFYAITLTALCTFFTRSFPFLLLSRLNKVPSIVTFLGQVLPPAITAIFVVFCFRDSFDYFHSSGLSGYYKEIAAICGILLVHKIKNNDVLSVFTGTAIYVILSN